MLFYERVSKADMQPADSSSTTDAASKASAEPPTFELSDELAEWIWKDNTSFLLDKNIFCHSYFEWESVHNYTNLYHIPSISLPIASSQVCPASKLTTPACSVCSAAYPQTNELTWFLIFPWEQKYFQLCWTRLVTFFRLNLFVSAIIIQRSLEEWFPGPKFFQDELCRISVSMINSNNSNNLNCVHMWTPYQIITIVSSFHVQVII